ncbi:hypothetical protein M5C95_19770 [Acidovorax sp. NCPPB 4044]|nr:hypothetical protein [Acidovorax sp. NCPPB 4044]
MPDRLSGTSPRAPLPTVPATASTTARPTAGRTESSAAPDRGGIPRRELPPAAGAGSSGGAALRAPQQASPERRSRATPMDASQARHGRPASDATHLPLLGYALARRLDGRPLPPEDIPRLQRAQDAVLDTRQALPLGRGNVLEDALASGYQSRYRAQAAYMVSHRMDRDAHLRNSDADSLRKSAVHLAAASLAAGAANCDGRAAIVLGQYAQRLQADGVDSAESVYQLSSSALKHSWAEARIPGQPERTIVLDAWTDGPAILAEDSMLATAKDKPDSGFGVVGSGAIRTTKEIIANTETLRRQPQELDQMVTMMQPPGAIAPLVHWFDDRVSANGRRPMPVIAPDFARRVIDQLDRFDEASMQHRTAEAIHVARAAGVTGEAELEALAPQIEAASLALIADTVDRKADAL